MPVFRLTDRLVFPPPDLASPEGILAVGGDLSPERLLLAYRRGIFPWYCEEEPILWWSPDPRCVLFPKEIRVSRSMRQLLGKPSLEITFDRHFAGVVAGCRAPRKGLAGTWIHDEVAQAYGRLHALGYAHSVEVWQEGLLVGGLYGVSLGRCFFGESMFSAVSNASKAALITLARRLYDLRFVFIDCQVPSDHLQSLGACLLPRPLFLDLLTQGLEEETLQGNWGGTDPADSGG
jgi:leucyl/phenylalanyl-tRNA--protein transferase